MSKGTVLLSSTLAALRVTAVTYPLTRLPACPPCISHSFMRFSEAGGTNMVEKHT